MGMLDGALRPWHVVIIVVLAIALFGGYKRLPDAAKSLGRSLHLFKSELNGSSETDAGDQPSSDSVTTSATVKQTPPQQSPVPQTPEQPVTKSPDNGGTTPGTV